MVFGPTLGLREYQLRICVFEELCSRVRAGTGLDRQLPTPGMIESGCAELAAWFAANRVSPWRPNSLQLRGGVEKGFVGVGVGFLSPDLGLGWLEGFIQGCKESRA